MLIPSHTGNNDEYQPVEDENLQFVWRFLFCLHLHTTHSSHTWQFGTEALIGHNAAGNPTTAVFTKVWGMNLLTYPPVFERTSIEVRPYLHWGTYLDGDTYLNWRSSPTW